jgi:2'-5' RNA ligase
LSAQVDRLRIARGDVNTRLVPPERWHLTLAFLGEVPDDRLPAAVAALADAEPVTLRLAGGGRFGRGRFTTLWTGVTGDVRALDALARTVRRALKRARLPYDRKPLKPHLTLARPGDRLSPEEIHADLTALAAYTGPDWTVGSIELVRSHQGPKPAYDHLAARPLGPG